LVVTAALSVAQFSSCFKEIEVDLACNLGECDTSQTAVWHRRIRL